MRSSGRKVGVAVLAGVAALLGAAPASAQIPGTSLTVGLAVSSQYPDRFQPGCGDPFAAAPSIRGHQRLSGWLTAELGISGLLQLPPGAYCTVDPLPLEDGQVYRDYSPSRGSLSLAGEGRLVLTPFHVSGSPVRLIGGGAWFVARNTPAWIVGAGFRPMSRWGAMVVDIERWSVGAAYDLERFHAGAPREHLGEGREWQALWQVRIGLTVWSH